MRTVTGLSHQPFDDRRAATATALEPEALVSPAPRSQTATVTSCGASTRDELDVRPVREALVRLEQRAEAEQLLASGSRADDRVRVADRDRGQLDPLAGELDRLDLAHRDVADGDLDRAVLAHVAGYVRVPTAIETCSSPQRRASQRAAMRVPLPENSAAEPSGFQIAISARAPSAVEQLERPRPSRSP